MRTTYGLGTDIRGPSGAGPGLATIGQDQQRAATQLLGQAADDEAQREIGNKQRKAADKAGKAQLGASIGAAGGMAVGAQYGSAMGPWGALAGGIIGALAGGLF